jgi:diguanylate cyclase (GGDEF)-like protein/PAS domain S-box-containing protein
MRPFLTAMVTHVTPPKDLLGRVRWLFLAQLALACLTVVPQLVFDPGVPVPIKLFALIVLVGLYGHWVLGYRLRGYPLISDAIDFAGLFFLGIVLQDPTRLLGVVFQALWLKATFGTARHAISTTAAFVAAFGAAMFVTMGPATAMQIGLGTIPNLMSVGLMGYLLARALSRQTILEHELRASETRFRSLVQNSSDVIMVVGPQGQIRFHTPSVERLLGVGADSLVGGSLSDLIHPDDRSAALAWIGSSAQDGPSGEWRILHRDGMWLHVEALSNGLLTDPSISGVVLTMRNITERKALERRLTHQALHDSLSDLPNRALLHERVTGALATTASDGIALLFIDLDDFKVVNDTLGHAAGDQLIVAVGRRLHAALREDDVAARIGGDEFAVMLEHIASVEGAEAVAERLIDDLQRPYDVAGRQVITPASIGIAFAKRGEISADELLRKADVAMYAAKGHGKARFEVYDPAQNATAERRASIKTDLGRAFEAGELFLEYQPLVRLADGATLGAEALLRWRHPERGVIPPLDFIPSAEESGLIIPIGRWVLLEACRQARIWQDAAPRDEPVSVSVNVSAKQLLHRSLIDHVTEALSTSGIDPRSLNIEVTETVLQHDAVTVGHRLDDLKALGVRIALDDFGSGYTSLGYLQRFPVDVLKIDRTFIKGVLDNDQDRALARAMLGFGKSLGLSTVAEGIEDEAQASLLLAMGCDLAQGYYFGRPGSSEAITATVSKRPVALAIG